MANPKGNLIRLDRKILEDGPVATKSLGCRLDQPCAQCRGKGFVVAPGGEHARAALCACVKGCVACVGSGCREEAGGVRPCRTPPVTSVINLINAAQIPARYAEATFDAFRTHPGRDPGAVQKLEQWRRAFLPRPGAPGGAKGKGLVVAGPVGVGKTYLLAAITRELAERGVSVRFTDFFQLLFDVRAGFSEGKSDSSVLNPLVDVDVLVIDELGKGRSRDYDKMVLDQLVSKRYAAMKTLIASTNYRLEDLTASYRAQISILDQVNDQEFESDEYGFLEKRIGRRIFSRLREMTTFVKLDGDDYRRRGPV